MKWNGVISRVHWGLVLVLILISGMARADQGAPGAVVARFQEAILGVMKDADALGVSGRFDRLAPRVEETFYPPLMVQMAVGPEWRKADETQQRRLIHAFTRMSISTLATFLSGYDGEVFEQVGEKPGPQDTTLVETRLVRRNGETVEITYVARPIRDQWRLIDVVVAGGVSELNVRRSEYRRILREKGIEGLIEALNIKADQLLSGKEVPESPENRK